MAVLPTSGRADREIAWSLVGVLLGLAVSFPAGFARADGPVLVDEVAALVGGSTPAPDVTVILRSDVELRLRLANADRNRAAIPDAEFDAALTDLIGEVLIAREAARLRLPEPTPERLEAQLEQAAIPWGGRSHFDAALEGLGVTRDEIRDIARRQAMVGAFLQSQLEGTSTISDGEVRRAFESGQHPFIGQTFEEARDLIRTWLGVQAMQRALVRWVEALRARTVVDIRVRPRGSG